MHFLIFISLIVYVNSQSPGLAVVSDARARLRKELLDESRYDRYNAPRNRTQLSLSLSMKLLALHISDIDEHAGTMTVNGHLFMMWNDYRLHWAPEDYEGVQNLTIFTHSLWQPELSIYNDASPQTFSLLGDADFTVTNDGNVYSYSPITLTTSCVIDHYHYPFDHQQCEIDIGNWAGEIVLDFKVQYTRRFHEKEVLEQFASPNPLWEVVERKDEVVNRTFEGFPDATFPYFQLRVGLRRQAPFYKFLLVTPGLMSTLLTLAVFWIPVQGHCNARLAVGAIATATFFLIIIHLAYYLPGGGKTIPAIASFSGVSLVMSALTFVVSIGNMKLNRLSRDTKPVPDLIKNIVRLSGKCISLDRGPSQLWAKFTSNNVNSSSHNKDVHGGSDNVQVEISGNGQSTETGHSVISINRDWIDVGIILDRICFIVYSFVFICLLFGLCFT